MAYCNEGVFNFAWTKGMIIKKIAKRITRKIGFEIIRYSPDSCEKGLITLKPEKSPRVTFSFLMVRLEKLNIS